MHPLSQSTIETILKELGPNKATAFAAPSNGLLDLEPETTIKPYDGDEYGDLIVVETSNPVMVTVPIKKEHLSYGCGSFDSFLHRYQKMTPEQVSTAATVADPEWLKLMDKNMLLQPQYLLQRIGNGINVFEANMMNTLHDVSHQEIIDFLLNKYDLKKHSVLALYFCLRKDITQSQDEKYMQLYERMLAASHDGPEVQTDDISFNKNVLIDSLVSQRNFVKSLATYDKLPTKVACCHALLDAFINQVQTASTPTTQSLGLISRLKLCFGYIVTTVKAWCNLPEHKED